MATVFALAAIVFFVGRELGVFSKAPTVIEAHHSRGTALESSTENAETTSEAENVEASENVENPEPTTDGENAENVESAAE